MDIREANPDDNKELQRLQAKCPQKASPSVSVVNTPDFFARAKAYSSYHVLVACENDRIIGSLAAATRGGLVNGQMQRLGYTFQGFTSPDHRRKGISGELLQQHENRFREQGVDMVYALIMENNQASMKLVENRGFRLDRSLTMPCLMVYRHMDVDDAGTIRSMTDRDLDEIARLLNDTWHGHEMYEPVTAEMLNRFIERTPAFDRDSLLVVEKRGEIVACLGFWDWSQIARITMLSIGLKVRLLGVLADVIRPFRSMPPSLRRGKQLKQFILTTIGFKDPGDVTHLLTRLNNLALSRGIEQIFCICEQNHPLLSGIRGFFRVDTGMTLYVKALTTESSLGPGPVFVDGVDL